LKVADLLNAQNVVRNSLYENLGDKMYVYKTRVVYEKKRIGKLTCENGFRTKFSAPPEFNGYEGFATPEDLFIASVNTCFMLTFESMCKKLNVSFQSFECDCEGRLESIDGKEMITKIVLKPKVVGENKEKIEKALLLAKKYCLVANSIKSEVVLEPMVESRI
jgi:organic hydroperoxide reductase OsmC/OhrA